MAATAIVANLDSFFTLGHNYCLYLHPETNKFHFIPWDVDLSLGNFPILGTPEQQMDLSLAKPYAAEPARRPAHGEQGVRGAVPDHPEGGRRRRASTRRRCWRKSR